MIYFDNSATSKNKPEEVYAAYNYYVRDIGVSPGRGSYSLGITASRMLYQSRKAVAKFFGINNSNNVVFTKNSTEAINLFFNGYLNTGDHVLISPFEHNAVLRPLHTLSNSNAISYDILPESVIYNNQSDLTKYIKPNTKLLVIMLASNLTGQIVFNRELSKIAQENGIKIFVDASQGAGKKLINMSEDGIDFLAFTGHKDMQSLPGTGGLCSVSDLHIKPLIQGGTGIFGDSYVNPEAYPDAYEAGTLNMPSIWALKNAIEFLELNHKRIAEIEKDLTSYCIQKLATISGVKIYNVDKQRVSTFCFNIEGFLSNTVVEWLDKYGICVRGGVHCAILAHESLGTVKTGAVRTSLNYFNTKEEIDYFIEKIKEMKKCM
jgi:cysteine desulfurase family protein